MAFNEEAFQRVTELADKLHALVHDEGGKGTAMWMMAVAGLIRQLANVVGER